MIGNMVNAATRVVEVPELTQEQRRRKNRTEDLVMEKAQCKNHVIQRIVRVSSR